MSEPLSVAHPYSDLVVSLESVSHYVYEIRRTYLSPDGITVIVYRGCHGSLFLKLHIYQLALLFAFELDIHVHRRSKEVCCHDCSVGFVWWTCLGVVWAYGCATVAALYCVVWLRMLGQFRMYRNRLIYRKEHSLEVCGCR